MNPYRDITVHVKDGGRLVTRASGDEVTPADFTVIRDFRRSLDKIVRREGHCEFWPNKDIDLGFQNLPDEVGGDPILLIHEARRPNGKTAIIAATKTKIYRYFALESGGYYSTDPDDYPDGDPNYFTPPDDPDVENVPTGTPYYLTDYGAWVLIGSGFSASGHRWEAVNLNGYAVLNNGVDLPVTYRVEELEVVPIYELRDQGVASVGTIAVMNGRLLCMDITEISSAQDLSSLYKIDSGDVRGSQVGSLRSGVIKARQYDGTTPTVAGNTVVASSAIFILGMVGKTITFSDGTQKLISAYVSTTVVTVGGSAALVNDGEATPGGLTFKIGYARASSGVVTASQSGTAVTSSIGIFTPEMVGWIIEYSGGLTSRIASYINSTSITMLESRSVSGETFTLVPPDFHITASSPFFTSDHEGREMVFDSGAIRNIVKVYTDSMATTDSNRGVGATEFFISLDPYGIVPNTIKTVRTHYRIIWSEDEDPRGFSASYAATAVIGENKVTLTNRALTFKAGDSVIITGAGVAGGALSATVTLASSRGSVIRFDEPVVTGGDVVIQRAEAIGSGVAQYDLEDDGSGIIRALPLRGSSLIVYKDTAIFEAKYTGDVEGLFSFQKICRTRGDSLYYRWTLIEIDSEYHIYAGRNTIYRFDLTNRVPSPVPDTEVTKDIVFDSISIDQDDDVYSAASNITNEVILFFSKTGNDRALAYDYLNGKLSTIGAYFSAAASVKRPISGVEVVNEEWFVLGHTSGMVSRYGLLSQPIVRPSATATQAGTSVTASAAAFTVEHIGRSIRYSDGTVFAITAVTDSTHATVNESATKTALSFTIIPAIYHREGLGYDSTLAGALAAWGSFLAEKKLNGYQVGMATSTPSLKATISILTARDAFSSPVTVGTKEINVNHMVPVFASGHLIQDKITVSGVNKPVEIVHRSFRISGVNTKGIARRVTE